MIKTFINIPNNFHYAHLNSFDITQVISSYNTEITTERKEDKHDGLDMLFTVPFFVPG